MKYKVYKITNKQNGKIYIGQTVESLKNRFKRHMGYQSREHDTYFYRAVNKYGKENFYIELIDTASSQKELDEKEYEWIMKTKSYLEEFGYNTKVDKGKCGGDTLSNHRNLEEIKKKISATKMGGKNPNSTKIKSINVFTKEEKYYDSMMDCQKELNIPRHDIIMRRCKGKIKKPYNGIWLFEYVEGVETIERVS